ncbi:MAG: D-cysteine desulfhydrase family protein [Chloroflexi bacterium]|nr:D-cysteine desulfhydrase family protein [Chloroflexota bacterium]
MKRLPRLALAHLPTPLEALPRLSAELGGPSIWVKRDDQTGLAFGGNKTRKLEYLAAAALAEGADRLITAGATQSNHCRQTAAAAARLGLACTLVLAGEEPSRKDANVLLDHLFGADIRWVSKSGRDAELQAVYEHAKADGGKPYLVPYGGSSPLGAAAYAYALEELLVQIQPDWIVFATSSGGTQAGLVAGAKLLDYEGSILGICVDEKAEELAPRVAALAGETTTLLGQQLPVSAADMLVNDGYLGDGYAVMGNAEREAIRLLGSLEGLLVDPVYTGRAAAGMIDLVRKGFFNSQDKVLFWHTGGGPALFADTYARELAS